MTCGYGNCGSPCQWQCPPWLVRIQPPEFEVSLPGPVIHCDTAPCEVSWSPHCGSNGLGGYCGGYGYGGYGGYGYGGYGNGYCGGYGNGYCGGYGNGYCGGYGYGGYGCGSSYGYGICGSGYNRRGWRNGCGFRC